jgi:peroxiredoxin
MAINAPPVNLGGLQQAPEIRAQAWLNTPAPITLAGLRGRVVVLHAFQMLCPGCVAHGTPQAQRIEHTFAGTGLQVLGIHTVFEHHAVMGRPALEVFIHEYRLKFPIAIDLPGERNPIPQTMQAYELNGTPSLVLIDRAGRVRLSHFGQVDDMQVGAHIATLLAEAAPAPTP